MDWKQMAIDKFNVDDSLTGERKSPRKSGNYLNLRDLKDRSSNHSEHVKGCRGFASAFQNLKIEPQTDKRIDGISFEKRDFWTSPLEYDIKRKFSLWGFQTREKYTMQLVTQGPEILNYQGMIHSPADVASFWKKDSRMWLWKSIRYAHKKNKMKYTAERQLSKNIPRNFKFHTNILKMIN